MLGTKIFPLARMRVFLDHWRRDRSGSYAVIFAISLVPILIAIGAAVDLSQAYIVKQRLTRALDAAGLAVGGMPGLTTAQLQAATQNFFDANYPAAKLGTPASLVVNSSGNVVTLSVNATMPTSIMGIIGVDTLKIGAKSQITRMGKKLKVALVLDTTGSMAWSSKLTTMQAAAKELIDTVSAAAVNPGDVKIAIVPFTVDVKVGTAYKTADWIKWTWSTSKIRTCRGGRWWRRSTCVDKSYVINPITWKGCVIDRDQNYDVSNTPATLLNVATLYPADNDSCYTQTLMPLSTDWTALKAKIDSLSAGGNTNTTIGLVWGWQMASQGSTVSAAAAPAKNLDKVIVFLTDGNNTENRFSTSQSAIDARTSEVCAAIKASGVIVYTIRVMDGNAALLKNCASDAGKYYSVTNASQLTTVFSSIAQALSNLRISQ